MPANFSSLSVAFDPGFYMLCSHMYDTIREFADGSVVGDSWRVGGKAHKVDVNNSLTDSKS